VILGHWGEMVPWFLDRLDEALPRRATKEAIAHRNAERLLPGLSN
jgi:predicted TIM-barrel fold metal-dependent hydrolase